MGRQTTNTAEVYLAANEVANVVDATFITPDREPILSGALAEDVPNVIGMGSRGEYALEMEVEIDEADTNGQVALNTAYENKSSVTLKYYPEGNTAGNTEHSGIAYVQQIPNLGGQGKNDVKRGTYRLVFDGAPTEGTVA